MPFAKPLLTSVLAALTLLAASAEPTAAAEPQRHAHERSPKLVIGITVDQMRPDYFYRYWDHYGEGGFKRLLGDGFLFRNAQAKHLHTATGPGHAAPYTGTTPRVHGLIGNRWYVPELGRQINVIERPGSGLRGVGTRPDYPGEKSPGNMRVTTIGDELRLHTGERSRTVSVSMKDRAAIISGGHTGQAYWYEAATGNFVTSSFYRDELPRWVSEFNERNLAQEFLQRTWEPLKPIETYVESRADRNPYERPLPGTFRPTFPMDLSEIIRQPTLDAGVLGITPFGDELLLELARTALVEEKLGQGEVTDMLLVGLSAADVIGHFFGPGSKQIQDYYIRLDAYLAEFLDFLDQHFERENILLVMTADHGGHYVPQYLADLGIPTAHEDFHTRLDSVIAGQLRVHLERRFGADLLLAFSGPNLHLDHPRMAELELDPSEVREAVRQFLLTLDPVADAITADALQNREFSEGARARAMHGYYRGRSGDVLVWLKPHTRGDLGTGFTGHGSPWANDVHVPILFYGADVPHGQSSAPVAPSDIASTLAVFLNSPFPSGNTGQPLNDLIFGQPGSGSQRR